MEYDDLFQAGCMGLIKAYDGFDESRGLRFSTYAVPVILGEIKRLFREGGSVKVSRRLKELSLKASRVINNTIKETGIEPTIFEIAQKLECSEEMLVEAMCSAKPSISLTCDDEDGENRIADIPILHEEEIISERLTLKDAIERLSDTERMLLSERFYKNKTQSETASILNTTQVQISRTERKIISKLREYMSD
ncbi:MAG: sigma-70 family RNA polymerase sigma factor [Oscillospiraceae bacterium]